MEYGRDSCATYYIVLQAKSRYLHDARTSTKSKDLVLSSGPSNPAAVSIFHVPGLPDKTSY